MSTVTGKGQVTIPKRVRERLGLHPGDRVDFSLSEDGDVIIAKVDGEKPVSRFAKYVGTLKTGMTTDEIMKLLRPED